MLTKFQGATKALVTASVAGVIASVSGAALAQAPQLTESQKQTIAAMLTAPVASPGLGIGVPTAFGLGSHQMFFSIGGVSTKELATNERDYDGSATLGMGFGDAVEFVAFEVQANVISLSDNAPGSDVGEEGSISLKLSRNVGRTSAVAVGVENAATWGDALKGTESSAYVAYTKLTALSSNASNPLTLGLTIGAGTDRFQKLETKGNTNGVQDQSPGVFGAISLAVHRQVSLIAEYNGSYSNAGISFVPLRSCPLTVTFSAINLQERRRVNGGTRTGETEFGGSIGYSWNF